MNKPAAAMPSPGMRKIGVKITGPASFENISTTMSQTPEKLFVTPMSTESRSCVKREMMRDVGVSSSHLVKRPMLI
jgi:hypothetical protein